MMGNQSNFTNVLSLNNSPNYLFFVHSWNFLGRTSKKIPRINFILSFERELVLFEQGGRVLIKVKIPGGEAHQLCRVGKIK